MSNEDDGRNERFGILARADETRGEILARMKREREFESKIEARLDKLQPPVGLGPRSVFRHLATLFTSIAGRELTEAEFGELNGIAFALDDLDICDTCQRRRVDICAHCCAPKRG